MKQILLFVTIYLIFVIGASNYISFVYQKGKLEGCKETLQNIQTSFGAPSLDDGSLNIMCGKKELK